MMKSRFSKALYPTYISASYHHRLIFRHAYDSFVWRFQYHLTEDFGENLIVRILLCVRPIFSPLPTVFKTFLPNHMSPDGIIKALTSFQTTGTLRFSSRVRTYTPSVNTPNTLPLSYFEEFACLRWRKRHRLTCRRIVRRCLNSVSPRISLSAHFPPAGDQIQSFPPNHFPSPQVRSFLLERVGALSLHGYFAFNPLCPRYQPGLKFLHRTTYCPMAS